MSKSSLNFKLFKSSLGISGLLLAGLLLAVIYSVSFGSTVYAAGAVGSGGSGSSGSSGAGHWTKYGHGWVTYPVDGLGPQDGFQNGYNWTQAQYECKKALTSEVYAYIVYDDRATGRIYDYTTGSDAYIGHFDKVGMAVDGGRATTISTSTASAAFYKIDKAPYLVDTSGYYFGTNVGWFCYNYQPPKWTITGTSKVSPTSGPTSAVATFTHTLKNIGPDDAKGWKYYVSFKDTDSSGAVIGSNKFALLSNETGSASLNNGVSYTITSKFPVPDSWKAGYKRCEWITWYSYKSPAPTSGSTARDTKGSNVCFTVTAPGVPVVTISCHASGGTYTVSGTAKDSDRAMALSIQYFKSGSSTPLATPIPFNTTNSSGVFSRDVTSFMGVPAASTGFYVKVKGVNPAGVQAPPDTTSSVASCVVPVCVTGSPGCPITVLPTPTLCPGDIKIGANSLVIVYLPDQTKIPSDHTAAPPVYTTDSSATYVQKVPLSKTLVTSVQDISIGGLPISPSIVGGSNNYQTVTLQYKDYVDGAPYDPNQASVTYNSDYRRTDWYVTFDHYKCDGYSPASLSGGGCSYSHPAPCSLGESLSGTTCSGSYSATAYYRWINNGTYNDTVSNTVNAYAMNACFNRNYNVSSVSATAAFDNNEDPSTADVTGNATVDFIVPAGFPDYVNLRSPLKVNLDFSAGPCPALSGSRTFNGSSTLALDSGSCPVSAPPLAPGQTVCIVYDVFPKSGEVKIDGTPVGATGTESSPPGCTQPVENNPYVHVLGLDASAGGNFASGLLDQCVGASPASGTISANLRSTGPLTRGSGVQLGALAIGSINGFASATYRTGPTPPVASSGLTFANDGANGNLGGQHCVPDYYSTMPSGATAISGSFSLSSFNSPRNPPVDQVYNASSDIVINGPSGLGAGIAEGNRIAIYVNGDVYINTDIKFKNESWSSEDNIPSLFIVAKGNIYVDPAVERLDGVYVAQPNGASGGTINTCAPGFASFSATLLYGSCKDHKLMVNGAFIANTVNFLRTFSSLRTSLGGERPGTTANGTENQKLPIDCDGNVRTGTRPLADTGHDCAAEIINFSPETYLTSPAMLPVGGPAVGKYDYITSLSPIL